MKLAYIEYKDFPPKPKENKNDNLNLILEDMDDVIKYYEWCGTNNGRKLMEAWDSIVDNVERGQEPWSHLPYDPIYRIAGLLSQRKMKEQPYSLLHLATDYDHIVSEKIQTMLKWIQNGKQVRVNHLGGTSPMDIFYIDSEIKDVTDEMVKSYLISGNIEEDGIPYMDIKHSTLVIENDQYLSKQMKKYLEEIGIRSRNPSVSDYDVFNMFKSKTEFLKIEMMYKLFDSIISQGVDHIITETTGMDEMQIYGMKKVLKNVMGKYPNKKLKVTILLNDKDKKDLFKIDSKNIKIKII